MDSVLPSKSKTFSSNDDIKDEYSLSLLINCPILIFISSEVLKDDVINGCGSESDCTSVSVNLRKHKYRLERVKRVVKC